MKAQLLQSTLASLLTVAVINACTSSSSESKNPSAAPEAKVEQVIDIVGTYKGISATCEDGTAAKHDDETTKATTLTFSEDGKFKSETKIKNSTTNSALETEGTYTIKDDHLTLITKSEQYEGNVGFVDETSTGTFTLVGEELTVKVGPSEDGVCSPDQALIVKYQKQQPQPQQPQQPQEKQPEVKPSPTATPAPTVSPTPVVKPTPTVKPAPTATPKSATKK